MKLRKFGNQSKTNQLNNNNEYTMDKLTSYRVAELLRFDYLSI